MSRRKLPPPTPPIPFRGAPEHDTIDAMGLTVMRYRREASPPDADGKTWWIPETVMGADLALIMWHAAGESYAIDGWEPQLGAHMHGGRYETLAIALAWLQRARDVRDGKRQNFRGV